MEDIRDIIKKQKKRQELLKLDKENAKQKKELEKIKRENGKILISKQTKSPFIEVLKSDIISIDDVRYYYKHICNKTPKHDKIQTKDFLINEIIKELEQSKTK